MAEPREQAFNFGSAFSYGSAFKYTPVSTEEQLFGTGDDYEDIGDPSLPQSRQSLKQSFVNQFVRKLIVGVFYVTLIVTFPISAFFCFKRIQSLQRCVVYRLGIRLPLKGPGIIIKFPIIDCIQIVDLTDYEFVLSDKTQLMTSDGSIIEFNELKCTLNVLNAIRSSAQLKDPKFNITQFCKLSLVNMISSTHVEDLENKTDIIMKQYEHNCNQYLNNWGYNCKVDYLPKFVVINRTNPMSPIVNKLMSMFGGGPPEPAEAMKPLVSDLTRLQTPTSSPKELTDSQIVDSLQRMSEKYRNYVFHDIFIAIQVRESDSNEFFTFSHSSGKVSKLIDKPNKVNINISADTATDLMRFCCDNDLNSVRITTNLM